MPGGNKKGGKKHKRGKKNDNFDRKLILKDPKEDQEYAKIKKVNGNGRYVILCFDGVERLGIAAGNIKRKTRIMLHDIVLVSLWEFQDNKCSIIHKYDEDEVQKLKSQGEFPKNINLDEENSFSDDTHFSFDMPSDEDESKEEKKEEKSDSESEEDLIIDVNDI
jgi:translation initiation factor 1A